MTEHPSADQLVPLTLTLTAHVSALPSTASMVYAISVMMHTDSHIHTQFNYFIHNRCKLHKDMNVRVANQGLNTIHQCGYDHSNSHTSLLSLTQSLKHTQDVNLLECDENKT